MEYLVTNGKTVLVIEAESERSAMDLAAPTLLVTDWDKKFGNLVSVPKPTTLDGWVELDRRMCVGNGDHYEHFGFVRPESKHLWDYVKRELEKWQHSSSAT